MAHVTSPTSYRDGKAFLWYNSKVISKAQENIISDSTVTYGLQSCIDFYLRKNNFFLIKAYSTLDVRTGIINVKVLYYPRTFSKISIASEAPSFLYVLYLSRLFGGISISKSFYYSDFKNKFRLINNFILNNKKYIFSIRHYVTKKRIQLNRWFRVKMFLGSTKLHLKKKFLFWLTFKKYYVNDLYKYKKFKLIKRLSLYSSKFTKKKSWWDRWRISRRNSRIHGSMLSNLISLRTGLRVKVNLMNVFNYLIKTKNLINFKNHQDHIWGKEYHFNKKFYKSYYDIVNSLYLLSYFKGLESMFITMVQDGLWEMHKNKIRPKRYFYFLSKVINNMSVLKDHFLSFRVTITGKLRGGTARTTTFSVGFGEFARQTISEDIRYEYGNIESKYGSFGVKLLTWRKTV